MSAYGDRTYRKRREALKRKCKANNTPCYLCGGTILYDADRKHPQSFEADHVESLASGGKLLGQLMPACKRCNGAKQGKSLEEYLATKEQKKPSPTRRTTSW